MNESNRLSDFPTEQFTICLFFDACGHQADLDCINVPEDMTMQELPKHLRCTSRGSRERSIRIVYTGAGEVLRFPGDAQIGNWLSWEDRAGARG